MNPRHLTTRKMGAFDGDDGGDDNDNDDDDDDASIFFSAWSLLG